MRDMSTIRIQEGGNRLFQCGDRNRRVNWIGPFTVKCKHRPDSKSLPNLQLPGQPISLENPRQGQREREGGIERKKDESK